MFSFDSRQLHPVFHFHQFDWHFVNPEKLHIQFTFEIENLFHFKPTLEINFPQGFTNSISTDHLNHFVFQYGLIEMVSYWKSTCSPKIQIHCGKLNQEQIQFWENLFYLGLGEFRYKNGITVAQNLFVHIECLNFTNELNLPKQNKIQDDLFIVPIGGGKDSIVTLEILRKNKIEPMLFFLNPRASSIQIAKESNIPISKWVTAKRQIDSALLKLNSQGYLNGHTPFSALLAFMSILVSVPLQVSQIILSNESSAEEGNLLFHGEIINHQYSKSLDFEKKFTQYSQKFLTPNTKYFSFLRPLKELQIAKLFARYKSYHLHFKSCNVGQKNDVWCGECSKCLFVWVILSPWLSTNEIAKIFGKNMWCDLQLLETLKQLAGITGNKPFECVGTIAEVRTALAMCIQKYSTENFPLLIEAQKWGLKISNETMSKDHMVPKYFMEMLQNELSC